jgi:hypothetical protein
MATEKLLKSEQVSSKEVQLLRKPLLPSLQDLANQEDEETARRLKQKKEPVVLRLSSRVE